MTRDKCTGCIFKSSYTHSKRVGFVVCSLNLFLNSDIPSLKTQVQKHYFITEPMFKSMFAFS